MTTNQPNFQLSLSEKEFNFLKNDLKKKEKKNFETKCLLKMFDFILKLRFSEIKNSISFMSDYDAFRRNEVLGFNVNFNMLYEIVEEMPEGSQVKLRSDSLGLIKYSSDASGDFSTKYVLTPYVNCNYILELKSKEGKIAFLRALNSGRQKYIVVKGCFSKIVFHV